LFPTFCRLCGADASELPLDGIDLTPQLLQGKPPEDRELFWELSREGALRRGSWKYLRTADGNEYLFDLDDDPFEKNNLSEQRSEVFAKLKTRHAQIAKECLKP
jgi:arylsulfatase A-like enzyme